MSPTPPNPPDSWHDPLWEAREKFKDLAIWCTCQLRGQIAKTWVFRIHKGRQDVYPHSIPKNPRTHLQQTARAKWAAATLSWHNLSDSDKLYWHRIGVRKKKPITSLNAFISWWMKARPTPPPPPPNLLDVSIFGWDSPGSTWRKALSDQNGKIIIS